jgi:hypothetical protein
LVFVAIPKKNAYIPPLFYTHITDGHVNFRPNEEKSEEEKKPIDNSKEAAIEAEVQAARQRAVVPLDIRMKQFRDMLAEKDVSFARIDLIYAI